MNDTEITICRANLRYVSDQVISRIKDENSALNSADHIQVEEYVHSLFPQKENLYPDEVLLLLIALIPHLDPSFFDNLFVNIMGEGNFPQLGGTRGKQHRGIIPTGEMALYLLAGDDLNKRLELQQEYFYSQHWLFNESILYLEPALPGEPKLSGKMLLQEEYVHLFLNNEIGKPSFGMNFPAQHITTQQEWKDLVLHPATRQQVQHLEQWLHYGKKLLKEWGMGKKIKRGYRALFYGPPGTGKTLTAGLLGKYTQREVYRVDLSMVVSKYIGETEKNLSALFDKSEHRDWILFFDEADALFGKRTGVRDAHDRYANQEISYLLQRVEDYDGLVILASNFKDNIDDSFLRRFQAIIHFPLPRPGERLQLWQLAFPDKITFDKNVNLKAIADQYELSGSDIMNICHFCCLNAMALKKNALAHEDLISGIQRELNKLGKKV